MNERGQASVELLGAVPLVLVVGLAAFAVLASHAATEQAGEAAEAGAVAILEDRDPRASARAALPPAVRPRAQIAVTGTHVHVRVRPRLPLPGLSDRLSATADAEAGPAAATPKRGRASGRRTARRASAPAGPAGRSAASSRSRGPKP